MSRKKALREFFPGVRSAKKSKKSDRSHGLFRPWLEALEARVVLSTVTYYY